MHNREALHKKSGKANFDLVYGLEDPREYFGAFEELDYCIPQHGQRVFSTLIEARREAGHNGPGERPTGVVDVCCSYWDKRRPTQIRDVPQRSLLALQLRGARR